AEAEAADPGTAPVGAAFATSSSQSFTNTGAVADAHTDRSSQAPLAFRRAVRPFLARFGLRDRHDLPRDDPGVRAAEDHEGREVRGLEAEERGRRADGSGSARGRTGALCEGLRADVGSGAALQPGSRPRSDGRLSGGSREARTLRS